MVFFVAVIRNNDSSIFKEGSYGPNFTTFVQKVVIHLIVFVDNIIIMNSDGAKHTTTNKQGEGYKRKNENRFWLFRMICLWRTGRFKDIRFLLIKFFF